jgi:hypothetical protein
MALSEEAKKKIEEEEYRNELRAKTVAKKRWYQKTIWIVVLLVLFFPVGLFLMWKYTKWNKAVKWIITGFFLLYAFSLASTSKTPTQPTQNNKPPVAKSENTPQPTKRTSRQDFKASVNFSGTQFVISNLDNLDCENAKMEVNGGLFSGGYKLEGYLLKAGETYTVGVLQFTKNDGTRLNPYQIKPKTFSIYCSSIGSTNALGGAGWYGEFQ